MTTKVLASVGQSKILFFINFFSKFVTVTRGNKFLDLLFSKGPQLLVMPFSPSTSFADVPYRQLRTAHTTIKYGGKITSFDQLSLLYLMQSKVCFPLLAAGVHGCLMLSLLSPASPDPFLLSCSPATCLLVGTHVWHYSVSCAELDRLSFFCRNLTRTQQDTKSEELCDCTLI